MNIVILQGRMVRDPELYTTDSGLSMLNFSLAVGRPFKDNEGNYNADFINCTASGKSAELVAQYVKKGNMLGVEGSWRTGSYVNKEGITVYTNKCQVSRIHLQPKSNPPATTSTGELNGIPVKTGRTNRYTPVQPVTQQTTPQQQSFLPKVDNTPEVNVIPQAFDIDMDDEFPF